MNCCEWCCIERKIRQIVQELIGGQSGKDGLTPHIGGNGNWWIGDKDTGVSATGTDVPITGLQMQVKNQANAEIEQDELLTFDITIMNNSDIAYNNSGEFTINSSGLYKIDYEVDYIGTGTSGTPSITLIYNNAPYAEANLLYGIGQMRGSALIEIDSIPSTISLKNTTVDGLILMDTNVQANIVITKLSDK